MNDAWITAIQTIVVAVMVFGGQFIVARLSKSAQSETTEVDAQSEATKAWKDYAAEMRARMDALEQQVKAYREQQEADRRRIYALERQSDLDLGLIRKLVHRLRAAFVEIQRLGGNVPAEDTELTEMAQIRLDLRSEGAN